MDRFALEECVDVMKRLEFQIYDSNKEFQDANMVPTKYVVRRCLHDTLYGTSGHRDALIVAPVTPTSYRSFTPDDDGNIRIILGVQAQGVSGSVDQKFPYILELSKVSPIQNWVEVLDGEYWGVGRGKSAADWFLSKANQITLPKRFYVLDVEQFASLANGVWGRTWRKSS